MCLDVRARTACSARAPSWTSLLSEHSSENSNPTPISAGDAAPPAAYRILCLRFAHPCSPRVPPRLRHGGKTRYGWVANPYPTGTFTLQETPSLSWREHAWQQPLETQEAPFSSTPLSPVGVSADVCGP